MLLGTGQYDPTQSTTTDTIPGSGLVGTYDGTLPAGTISATGQGGGSVPNKCGTQLQDDSCGGAVVYGTTGHTTGMEGEWLTDVITLGNLSARAVFLYMTTLKYDFEEAPVGGIMGVSGRSGDCLHRDFQSAETGSGGKTCGSDALHLLLTGNNYHDTFGLCLGQPQVRYPLGPSRTAWPTADGASLDGALRRLLTLPPPRPAMQDTGVLSLGGGNPNFYAGEPAYTALKSGPTDSDYYAVTFGKMQLGSKVACSSVAECSGELAILDTGTNLFVLNQQAYDGLAQAANGLECSTDADCKLDLELGLHGVELCLRTTGFFTCQAQRCGLGAGPSGGPLIAPTQGQTIIGYAVLKQFYLIFDRGSATDPGQVGFATRQGECAVACSAFKSQWPCVVAARCQWAGGLCTGTQAPSTIDRGQTGATVSQGTCSNLDATQHPVEM